MVVSQGSFNFAGHLARRGLCQGEGHGEQASCFPEATSLWHVTVPAPVLGVTPPAAGPSPDLIWRERNVREAESEVP